MSPVGFEPTISAGERLRTYALDRAANGTGAYLKHYPEICLEGLGETTKHISHVRGYLGPAVNTGPQRRSSGSVNWTATCSSG